MKAYRLLFLCIIFIIPFSSVFAGSGGIDDTVAADRIPAVMYRIGRTDQNYELMVEGMFDLQMHYLWEQGYRGVTSDQLATFVSGQAGLPYKSVVLAFQLAGDTSADFETYVLPVIQSKGLHAIVCVPTAETSEVSWQRLAAWQNAGLISVCSTGTNYQMFGGYTREYAAQLAGESINTIRTWIPNQGAIGFAYPYGQWAYTDIPSSVGFSFQLMGPAPAIENNNARPGNSSIHTLFPYTGIDVMSSISANSRNYPLDINLQPYWKPFDFQVFMNTTPFGPAAIGAEPLWFAESRPNEVRPHYQNRLVVPTGLVIHTTAQPWNEYQNWHPANIRANVHFGVGWDGVESAVVLQYMNMYSQHVTPISGNGGDHFYLGIEMCGVDYDRFDDDTPQAQAIRIITESTVELTVQLIQQYGIPYQNVVGHYERTATGKPDPGQRYMEEYFRPMLRARLGI